MDHQLIHDRTNGIVEIATVTFDGRDHHQVLRTEDDLRLRQKLVEFLVTEMEQGVLLLVRTELFVRRLVHVDIEWSVASTCILEITAGLDDRTDSLSSFIESFLHQLYHTGGNTSRITTRDLVTGRPWNPPVTDGALQLNIFFCHVFVHVL